MADIVVNYTEQASGKKRFDSKTFMAPKFKTDGTEIPPAPAIL